jgi:hypothetical protein
MGGKLFCHGLKWQNGGNLEKGTFCQLFSILPLAKWHLAKWQNVLPHFHAPL